MYNNEADKHVHTTMRQIHMYIAILNIALVNTFEMEKLDTFGSNPQRAFKLLAHWVVYLLRLDDFSTALLE